MELVEHLGCGLVLKLGTLPLKGGWSAFTLKGGLYVLVSVTSAATELFVSDAPSYALPRLARAPDAAA